MTQRKVLFLKLSKDHGALADEIRLLGWDTYVANDIDAALAATSRHDFQVGLMLLDSMHGDAVHEEIESLSLARSHAKWVALLPAAMLEHAHIRQLIADCFYDYHTLPADLLRLDATLGHALGMAKLNTSLDDHPPGNSVYPKMLGESPAVQEVVKQILKLSTVDAPLLVTGESGTGKELAVRAIHELSARKDGPFVAVNCGAIPTGLIQAELFGHEKGAFTGAVDRRIGRIEAASGGTLFLDEISELSLESQVNLLRLLQESTIQRLGKPVEIPIDLRIVAATHANLEDAVAKGQFRHDLYYRIHAFQLRMPALRERDGDIELLARTYLAKFRAPINPAIKGFSQSALRTMAQHTWPGNVRELINRVHRAVVMCEGTVIGPKDLGLCHKSLNGHSGSLETARGVAEKDAVERALRHARNNLSEAARRLVVSRPSLYRLMEKYGLSR